MDSTLRRTWAEIDLDAIEDNFKRIRTHVGEAVRFMGIVKADAYGHGAVRVAEKLQRAGADYLAVSSLDEAMELRFNGITMPVLILGHTPKEEVDKLLCFHITQAVTCEAKAEEYSREASRLGGCLSIHIKVDTGMSRLGYLSEGVYFKGGTEGIAYSCDLPGLFAEGIFTHFSMADEEGEEAKCFTDRQLALFQEVISEVEKKRGRTFSYRHCANSGAVFSYPQTYLDMVRPGLLLYGYGPFARKLGLSPVMTLKTGVSTIKIFPKGTRISYGGSYETDTTMRIGVVPCGYADGLMRCLSNRYSLWTTDGPAPIRGKICMDMTMIDLTDKPGVDVESEIEIFGKNHPVEDMAEMAGTIVYELTCAVSKRVARVYREDGEIRGKELLLRM